MLRAGSAGLGVIGYHSRPSRVELPADKFDAYLKEEGLDGIVALRGGDAGRAGTREQFFRCAKSLLMVGAPARRRATGRWAVRSNWWSNATRTCRRAVEELAVRLTYEGRPLPGALVVALRRTDAVERVAARSDADGRVRLRLARRRRHVADQGGPHGARAGRRGFGCRLVELLGFVDVRPGRPRDAAGALKRASPGWRVRWRTVPGEKSLLRGRRPQGTCDGQQSVAVPARIRCRSVPPDLHAGGRARATPDM